MSTILIKLYMVLNTLLELSTQTSILFFLLSVFDNLATILTYYYEPSQMLPRVQSVDSRPQAEVHLVYPCLGTLSTYHPEL